jgi:hypothetical protein
MDLSKRGSQDAEQEVEVKTVVVLFASMLVALLLASGVALGYWGTKCV